MKHVIMIDQRVMASAQLSLNRYCVLDLIVNASSWAQETIIKGKAYWWLARQNTADELRVVCDIQPDTVYRIYCDLQQMGLVEYTKDGVKDLLRATDKAKELFRTMSDSNPNTMSDDRPNELGRSSESGSDDDPTYPTTKINQSTKEQKKKSPSHRAIMPKVYDRVAVRYEASRMTRWESIVTFSKSTTLCITLANLNLPTDPGDPIHDRILETIQNSIDNAAYTPKNRKPITSVIEAAYMRLQAEAEAVTVGSDGSDWDEWSFLDD